MSTNQPISSKEQEQERKPLVLVIDDDNTHRKLMGLLADRLDITTQCVSSCVEALAVMERSSFDLILMDCRMPDIDGRDCSRRIRERAAENARKIPIIAVTTCVMPDDEQSCLDAGMDDYLQKPFTFKQMHEKLCSWLYKRQTN